ncbi:CRAL/TRIO domain-containing protein [Panus rudis PR-1116 ss-1]|nr:CRAL/TRIO domain-containing protein [Panus rudis PR-1116 ss-1]
MSEPTATTTAPAVSPVATAPEPEQAPETTTTTESPAAPAPEPAAAPSAHGTAADAPKPEPTPASIAETKEPEEPEPQNELTKKFTEREWRALREFRRQLPQIFAEAYHPDSKGARSEPVKLWGVTIDPYAPNKDPRVSVVLMKFLRARELNVKNAREMLVATLRWRDEFKVDELVKEEFPQDIFGKLGFVAGKDKDGHPVTYNLYGAITDMNAVFGDIKRFIRWRVSLMEKSIELLDFQSIDQMVQIHDYDGVSLLSGRDPNQKAAAAEATNIFQNHYPEFLSKKFFINVPTVLTWIFWLFKPLVSANTLAKMSVVGKGQSTVFQALSPVIPKDQLPKRYGGDAPDLA